MEGIHYKNYESITRSIAGFTDYARLHDFNVGIRESGEVLKAARMGMIDSRHTFYIAVRSIFCQSKEDLDKFESLFEAYWQGRKNQLRQKITRKNRTNLQKKGKSSLVLIGTGRQDSETEEGENMSGANSMERLRKTDFSKVADIDGRKLEDLALRLWKQMSLRLKKKLKNSHTKGFVDVRKTIRHNISHGGMMLDLQKKHKKPTRNRIIVLLDVSGSMDKYSFYLLRFIWALRMHFQQVEAFIFSTSLIRITGHLNAENLNDVLGLLSAEADNWSGGTKIGGCLKDFNERYAKRVLSGRSVTLVLSDGLDTGEPEALAKELKKIRRKTRQLIWLNPLKGMEGYQPVARGMKAALPEIDQLRSAHNLESILALENFLSHV